MHRRLATALLVLWAAACGPRPTIEPETAVEAGPQRVIALAPSASETLFALGLGERVVGVGDFSRWPPEAAGLPRLGGLLDVRLETIAALHPDLAILMPSEDRLARQLERLGTEVLVVAFDTLADVESSILTIGRRLGAEGAAERLTTDMALRLAPRSVAPGRRSLITVGRTPGRLSDLLAAGPGTFLGELLERLGAQNVAPSGPSYYPQLGLEGVLVTAPTAILELQPERMSTLDLLADWQPFRNVPAVAVDCVRVLVGSHVLIAGPRLPRLYDEMASALASCDPVP